MFELEGEAEAEHRRIGELLAVQKFSANLLCGKLMTSASEASGNIQHFENSDELIAFLKKNPFQEATILIKGSRGMRLEKVVEFL